MSSASRTKPEVVADRRGASPRFVLRSDPHEQNVRPRWGRVSGEPRDDSTIHAAGRGARVRSGCLRTVTMSKGACTRSLLPCREHQLTERQHLERAAEHRSHTTTARARTRSCESGREAGRCDPIAHGKLTSRRPRCAEADKRSCGAEFTQGPAYVRHRRRTSPERQIDLTERPPVSTPVVPIVCACTRGPMRILSESRARRK